MLEYDYTDELYHYGVPGMKWGVRKPQDNNESRRSWARTKALNNDYANIKEDYIVEKRAATRHLDKSIRARSRGNERRADKQEAKYIMREKQAEALVEAFGDVAIDSIDVKYDNLGIKLTNRDKRTIRTVIEVDMLQSYLDSQYLEEW